MPAQITSLLSNKDLDRLGRLRLNVSRHFTNRARGEHLAAKGGRSTEFCDFRDYSPGDDTRFVDWNIFARINRPYLKQFHEEEEVHVAILVDGSESMRCEGKFELALKVAAAMGTIGLRNTEKVSAFIFGGSGERLPRCSGRASLQRLFSFLESAPAGGPQTLDVGVETFLRQHKGRGAAIVISDFLTPGDLKRSFNLLSTAGLELFALQILAPCELNPELNGDFRLIDSENEALLDISSGADLLSIYHDYRARLELHLANLCRQRAGHFMSVSSAEPFERLCFETFRKRGWIQ